MLTGIAAKRHSRMAAGTLLHKPHPCTSYAAGCHPTPSVPPDHWFPVRRYVSDGSCVVSTSAAPSQACRDMASSLFPFLHLYPCPISILHAFPMSSPKSCCLFFLLPALPCISSHSHCPCPVFHHPSWGEAELGLQHQP